ncbi:unnamed protein product, partial [Iphiclides podalirius]
MARTKNNSGENNVDPATVQANVKSSIHDELMKELLADSFEDDSTKINTEGLALVLETAKCLVSETCLRAASTAVHENCEKVGMTNVEKILTQVLCDF